MTSGERMANDVDVDLGHLFASLIKRWRRIAFFTLALTAVVFLLAVLATPKYRAETRLLIEARESVYTRPLAAGNSERAVLDAETVASQVEVITSAEILTQVARELGLADREEFEDSGPSMLESVLMTLGLKSGPAATAPEERVLEAFREKLQVYRVENSRVIVIQFSSEDPQLAREVPNAIANAYVASLRAAKLEANVDATQWLEPEIADLRERVRDAEARVADFRSGSGLLFGGNNTVLATQQLAELSSELSRVRASRASAEAQAASVRDAIARGAPLEALPEVQASNLIQRLRERQVELRAEIADLSTTYLGDHPRIRALRSQLADLNTQIQLEMQRVLEALETEAATARGREQELMSDLEAQKDVSSNAEEQQVELRALEREAAAQRQLLESYLTRYREAVARGDRSYLPVDARIFSRALQPSEPYFPKVMPITLAAFAASLLVMCVITLLQELFSGRALRPADSGGIEPVRQVEMPAAIAAAPAEESTARATELGEVDVEVAAEALISSGVARAIVVSPEGDEAAASAVLVAREVADAGLRVLLLDLTASGAASRPMLESRAYPGITNLLTGESQFADIIHADLYSSCHIIPIGTGELDEAMRGIDRLPIIMGSLTTAYDLVVAECGDADAAAVRRLMEEDARILVSVLDPSEESIAAATRELRDGGFSNPLMVNPSAHMTPTAPPGRDVA
ncbi:GumC family protein [Chelativorans sp. M5D2P16]|uniref:GumC family protein n=1 Tax=Chelativorans sp. M5D2P16 TaxID=3095678 RepID=UPI002ACA3D16|nr:Wzz/FepE/Etk N-terminal domain-containing protein [Chelativorans sp. M5D2P16]MDZ5696907.1 Wzz/FepE/Etk N-terminal domain-containing protein [Chelativorans sp. M5D2P16]